MNAEIFTHASPLDPEIESFFAGKRLEPHQHTCIPNDLFQLIYKVLLYFLVQTRNRRNSLRHFGNKHLYAIQNVNTNFDALSVMKHALSVHYSLSPLVNVCYSQWKHQSMISHSDLNIFLYTVTLDIELLSLVMLCWISCA